MKKTPTIFSIIFSSIAYFAFNLGGYANTAVTTGTISATIMTPLSLGTPTQQVSFGTIFKTSSQKTITISSDSTSPSSPNTTVSASGVDLAGDQLVGIIPVTGEPSTDYQYGIGIASSSDNGSNHTVDISIANPAENSMNVTLNIKSDLANGSAGTLSNTGNGNLIIGGVLTVNASQPSGIYSGSYSVSVNY